MASCSSQQETWRISTDMLSITNGVSSGSGLAVYGQTFYLIGDDAEYVGRFDIGDTTYQRINWYPAASQQRIERSIKHDLESATIASIDKQPYILAFGSGVLSPFRDTLFGMKLADTQVRFRCSLQPLYTAIRTKAGLQDNELNIEGAAIAGSQLLLLNRGKNLLISILWADLETYIQRLGQAPVPAFRIQPLSLPVVNNYPVGCSGLAAINDRELLFTASLEETKDLRLDGTVKGSYIGKLQLDKEGNVSLAWLTELAQDNASITADKLESIDVLKADASSISAIATADNDIGSSKIFYLRLNKQ